MGSASEALSWYLVLRWSQFRMSLRSRYLHQKRVGHHPLEGQGLDFGVGPCASMVVWLRCNLSHRIIWQAPVLVTFCDWKSRFLALAHLCCCSVLFSGYRPRRHLSFVPCWAPFSDLAAFAIAQTTSMHNRRTLDARLVLYHLLNYAACSLSLAVVILGIWIGTHYIRHSWVWWSDLSSLHLEVSKHVS